ncbi:MAG: hypothetical protein R2693_03220 [Nocardioidaceae bacterium]
MRQTSVVHAAAVSRVFFATWLTTQKMTLQDGTELTPALGIGAFVEDAGEQRMRGGVMTRAPARQRSACSVAG